MRGEVWLGVSVQVATLLLPVVCCAGVGAVWGVRKHTYPELKSRGLGAQAAQHTIKKVRDAYTTLKANIKAGNLGIPGSKRRRKAGSKPIAFRPAAAQPYDDRCLSWQYDAQTVSIWTTAGRIRGVRFACSADGLKMLREHRQGRRDAVEQRCALIERRTGHVEQVGERHVLCLELTGDGRHVLCPHGDRIRRLHLRVQHRR